jgi:hypothetical protein
MSLYIPQLHCLWLAPSRFLIPVSVDIIGPVSFQREGIQLLMTRPIHAPIPISSKIGIQRCFCSIGEALIAADTVEEIDASAPVFHAM